jgi:ATP-binding cassette subfamily F protein uup
VPPVVRNLVNLNAVGKGYASRTVLEGITLGIAAGERIGVVGRNGEGKSTLLSLIAGSETPDEGNVVAQRGLEIARLGQGDELGDAGTIRAALVGEMADHEWAGDSSFRDVLDGLLGGVALSRFPEGMETPLAGLSGGERRRIALARLLLGSPELLLLDEPTNHLDVEAITWLAGHLVARRGAILVVTHDRWFLDAVCTSTWEVADGTIFASEGGYAAYVLARAERDRHESAREDRRRQLVRKELAWLRRGPPARTSKPKFRIEAANALIADEPPARDTTELLRFAGSRLGDRVLDAEDISLAFDGTRVLDKVTWRLGPGDRVALVGVNGSGKTSLLKLLAGEQTPDSGAVQRGQTVRLAHLSQDTVELPSGQRVLESLEAVRQRATLSDGVEITAALLCDRFGFRGDRARTFVRDLSGGERRRLALMRLLMAGPNVLLLDEPTNDLDIDTLTALEDLLDGWPGTLVIVSHDRYFCERVTDNVYGLPGDGSLVHLPGGMEQYLAMHATAPVAPSKGSRSAAGGRSAAGRSNSGAETRRANADARASRKEAVRLEREIERSGAREQALHAEMVEHSGDHVRLGALQEELRTLLAEREQLEAAWLEAAESLEDA